MANFGPKLWVNLFGKMLVFPLFQLFVFIDYKGVFSMQNIVKKILVAYIAKKIKVGKTAICRPKHGLTPLGKCQFFDFLNFLFLQPRKAFFRSRISKNTFSWPILPKKKVGKLSIFGPKPWVNPLEKCQFFDFFNFSVLQPKQGLFRFIIS